MGPANSEEGAAQKGSRRPCDSRVYGAILTILFTGGGGWGGTQDAISRVMGTVVVRTQ